MEKIYKKYGKLGMVVLLPILFIGICISVPAYGYVTGIELIKPINIACIIIGSVLVLCIVPAAIIQLVRQVKKYRFGIIKKKIGYPLFIILILLLNQVIDIEFSIEKIIILIITVFLSREANKYYTEKE